MNRASETIGAIAAALASDLDAPDLDARPGPAGAPNGEESFSASSANRSKPARNERQARRSTLATAVPAPLRDQLSAVLREQLLCELAAIFGPDEAAEWARKTLPAKNTLTGGDARLVEEAFARRLASFEEGDATAGVSAQALALVPGGPHIPLSEPPTEPASIDKTALAVGEPRRRRNKVHLRFVAREPCLVCGRTPCDPHHLRFAQKRALGRKVSDEYCVPLCRTHHRELHRSGNEARWWENVRLDPTKIARKLWQQTRLERTGRPGQPALGREAPQPAAAAGQPAGGEPSTSLAAEHQ